jgi:hypothetical protein
MRVKKLQKKETLAVNFIDFTVRVFYADIAALP